jgi:hypothetical protein
MDLGRSAAADQSSASTLVGLQIPDSLHAFLNPTSSGNASGPIIIGTPISDANAKSIDAQVSAADSLPAASVSAQSKRRVAFNTPLSPKRAMHCSAVSAQAAPSDMTASAFYAAVGSESAVLLNDSVLLTAYPTGTGTMADVQTSTMFAPAPHPPQRMPPSPNKRANASLNASSEAPAFLPWLFGASGPDSQGKGSAAPETNMDNFIIGAGVGYACLLISVVASYLDILLPFPIHFSGTRSFVVDKAGRFASRGVVLSCVIFFRIFHACHYCLLTRSQTARTFVSRVDARGRGAASSNHANAAL